MTFLREIAAAAVLSGALMTGGAVATAAPASADPGVQMVIEHGPFSSYDLCEIHRHLNDHALTTPCDWLWDAAHPFGFYYVEL